jgi:hypothetical protein
VDRPVPRTSPQRKSAGDSFRQEREMRLSESVKWGQASRFESIGRSFKQSYRRSIKCV